MRSTVELLQDLVRLPSVNPMGRDVQSDLFYEHRVTAYLERYLHELGMPTERQRVAEHRDNIIARYVSRPDAPTILWEVHQDTVPVDGMTIDPFAGEVRAGRLYGRGSCDVKGSMACMLSALARLIAHRPSSAANIILACTVDEEHTFLGVQRLVETVRADYAIVAEPTRLQIVDAHKGVVRWKVRTEGRACHSSRPDQGVNAVYRMGPILIAIEQYADELMQSTSHPRLGPPTLSVGRIYGGVSVNTVPDQCIIEIDRRLLPGEVPQQAWQHFRDYIMAKVAVPLVCDEVWMACPALDPTGADRVRQALGAAINAIEGQHEIIAVPFGTDASSICNVGVPAVVFGPGDIAQAHTKDEWIEVAQLDRAVDILYHLATHAG